MKRKLDGGYSDQNIIFYLFFIFKSPQRSLLQFESIGLSGQEKKRKKIDFQDGRGGHLGFPIGTILAIFLFSSHPMLPTKFRVNWPFGSGEEAKKKIDFQDGRGGHLGFPIGTILAFFDLQVTRCILPSFESTGLSHQEKKRKIDFPDGRHGGLLGFPIIKILTLFYL